MECAFWKCYCGKTVKHIDWNWCFSDSQHYNFWYSCLTFAKKKREIRKILIWKQWKIYIIKFFWNFLKKIFRFQIAFWVDLKRKKIFKKILKKIFDQKKLEFFFKLNFFSFPFTFLQRFGLNIKSYNVGYLKSISSCQYV